MLKTLKEVAYPAVLDDTDNEKGVYTVTFPDVPEAISEGKGIADAMLSGADALGLVLYDRNELPKPTDIGNVKKDNADALVTYIAVDLDEAKKHVILPTVKKNTTLPGELAKRAEDANINFSQTLKEALENKLKRD